MHSSVVHLYRNIRQRLVWTWKRAEEELQERETEPNLKMYNDDVRVSLFTSPPLGLPCAVSEDASGMEPSCYCSVSGRHCRLARDVARCCLHAECWIRHDVFGKRLHEDWNTVLTSIPRASTPVWKWTAVIKRKDNYERQEREAARPCVRETNALLNNRHATLGNSLNRAAGVDIVRHYHKCCRITFQVNH